MNKYLLLQDVPARMKSNGIEITGVVPKGAAVVEVRGGKYYIYSENSNKCAFTADYVETNKDIFMRIEQ